MNKPRFHQLCQDRWWPAGITLVNYKRPFFKRRNKRTQVPSVNQLPLEVEEQKKLHVQHVGHQQTSIQISAPPALVAGFDQHGKRVWRQAPAQQSSAELRKQHQNIQDAENYSKLQRRYLGYVTVAHLQLQLEVHLERERALAAHSGKP